MNNFQFHVTHRCKEFFFNNCFSYIEEVIEDSKFRMTIHKDAYTTIRYEFTMLSEFIVQVVAIVFDKNNKMVDFKKYTTDTQFIHLEFK